MVAVYNKSTTNALKFEFKPSGLICGDELIIDPIAGEIPPGGFSSIKLSLIADFRPSIYEGEIECEVDWGRSKESIFLRLKKRVDINVALQEQDSEGVENELIKNIMKDVLQSVLTENRTSEIIENIVNETPSMLYSQLDNDTPVFCKNITGTEVEDPKIREIKSRDQLFLEPEFLDTAQGIIESSLYKIMKETLDQEFNPFTAPKKYLRNK
jgi:hypothetical protein